MRSAVRDKAGLFEVAGGGTIFLDEIGEVGATVQAKLLRALQEREIRRVGGERNIPFSARVVAATNRDLRAAVEAGTFREDLYFRLGAFIIDLPPLRERREDIPALVHSFLVSAATRMDKDVRVVSSEAMSVRSTPAARPRHRRIRLTTSEDDVGPSARSESDAGRHRPR